MNDSRAARPSLKRSTKEGKESPAIITLPDCDCAGDYCSVRDQAKRHWDNGTTELVLELVTENEASANGTLLLLDFFARKPPGTIVTARACTRIVGPGFALWLAADRRWIRPTAYFYLRPPVEVRRRWRSPWDESPEPWQVEAQRDVDFCSIDYKLVLAAISQYVPVKEFLGKCLTASYLDEWGLLSLDLMKDAYAQGPSNNQPRKGSVRNSAGRGCEKRVWFVSATQTGRWTLQGGYPLSAMAENPELREKHIPLDFGSKDELLCRVDVLGLCTHDHVIIDGDQIVRGG